MREAKTYEQLLAENEALQWQLEEANDTLHAIRTGQVDALVVQGKNGAELYSLKTADQTYRVFIEKMNEGAVTLNDEGIILYCNSMFASMVELPLSQVMGRLFGEFIPAECKSEYETLFHDGWDHDRKLDMPIQAVSRQVPCQLSVTTLQLDEGMSLSVIVTDLTYQKEIQGMLKSNNLRLEHINTLLQRSNHDLLQFASVASHDLQEPLRKIIIFSDMLRSKLSSDTNDHSFLLNKIANSAFRLKSMISDILAYSKLSQNNAGFEPTNLNEVISEIIDDFEIMITEKGAHIHVSHLPTLNVSRGQIRQVFQNLISNALKFSNGNSAPLISIDSENEPAGYVTIIVKDNGIGFDSRYADKIFTLFHRLNTKDKYEGSGIGLAVTKKIIDKHGGSISAQSEEGVGSEFKIVLPRM
jgi:two-component system CheB/CheR fusion protein